MILLCRTHSWHLVSRDVRLLQNPFSYVHRENGRRGRSWHRDMLVEIWSRALGLVARTMS